MLRDQAFGVLQQRAYLRLDGEIDQIGAHLRVVAHALAPEAMGIAADAAIACCLITTSAFWWGRCLITGSAFSLLVSRALGSASGRVRPPAPETRDCVINLTTEGEGAGMCEQRDERAGRGRNQDPTLRRAPIGHPRLIIVLADPRAGALFADELHCGQVAIEVGMEEGVDAGELRDRLWPRIAVVADELADHAPILLLDVSLIVLMVRLAAREGQPFLRAIAQQVRVKELAPVVRVDAAQREREARPQRLERGEDTQLALVGQRGAFRPAGRDVGRVEGMDVLACRGGPTVGDQINLQEARLLFVSGRVRPDRDLALEQ